MYVFNIQWLYNHIQNLNVSPSTKQKLWGFLASGGVCPLSNLYIIICSNTWGLFPVNDWDYDLGPVSLELNNFSNYPKLVPWYYESENLEMFEDGIIEELTSWTSDYEEEKQLIHGLSITVSYIFGEVLKFHRAEDIGQTHLHVNMNYINNAIVITLPTEYEG